MTAGRQAHGSGWALAIDFGTTTTTAAIVNGADVTLVRFSSTTRMPSGVFVDPDEGLLAATAAVNRGGADPSRYIRTPKRHVGRDDELVVAGDCVSVTVLVAKVLGTALAEATRQAGGVPPDHVVLTHPARWGIPAQRVLQDAAVHIGIAVDSISLVPEPVAAGHDAATGGSGARVAVYDLGGGTFDAVVLACDDDGSWSMAGRPGGIDPFGGESIDAALHRHLVAQVMQTDPAAAPSIDTPATVAERGLARTWWRDLRALKEDLSESSSCSIAVPGTGHSLLVTREELESLIEAPLARSLDEFERTVRSAGIEPDQLTEILLCGDASRMPIVARMVADRFDGVTVRSADDPKGVVARGAVTAAAAEANVGSVTVADVATSDDTDSASPDLVEVATVPGAGVPPTEGAASTAAAPSWVLDPDPTAATAPSQPGQGEHPTAPVPSVPAAVASGPRAGIPVVGPDGTVLEVVPAGAADTAGPVASAPGRAVVPGAGTGDPFGTAPGGPSQANGSTGSTGTGKVLALVAVVLVVLVGAAVGVGFLVAGGDDDPGGGGGGGGTSGTELALLKAHFGITAAEDCTFGEVPPTAKCADAGPAELPAVTVAAAYGKHASASDLAKDVERYRNAIPSDATVFADGEYVADGNAESSSITGTLLSFEDSDENGDVVYRMVASEEVGNYIVEVSSSDYDAAEWALIEAVGGSSVRKADEAFGTTFGLDEFVGCWPNLTMLLVDGPVTSYDCWSTRMGEGPPAIQAEFREVADAGGAEAALASIAEANPGDVVVESGEWNSDGVPQGYFHHVTRGTTGYTAHIYWTNSDEPALLGHLLGTDSVALSEFWSAAALP